jgi:hypothetical protein
MGRESDLRQGAGQDERAGRRGGSLGGRRHGGADRSISQIPLPGMVWPSGWAWGQGHGHYHLMIMVSTTLGVFLIILSKNPAAHTS